MPEYRNADGPEYRKILAVVYAAMWTAVRHRRDVCGTKKRIN